MSFFIRLFSKKEKKISADIFNNIYNENIFFKIYTFHLEKLNTHNQILIKKKQKDIAVIIELLPKKSKLDNYKLKKITADIQNKKPDVSSRWVKKYLEKTKVVYEFILTDNLNSDNDMELLSNTYMETWVFNRGIFQIKNEGFTNESGDLILWDYPFSAAGKRLAAIKSFTGRWKTFEMDLESPMQRKLFLKGKVPDKSKLIYRG